MMASYLQRYDATPVAERWPLVRRWMHGEPLAFYAELRKDRPILVMPELTLWTRFDDCLGNCATSAQWFGSNAL
jgi:hypothetical protein